MEKISVSELCRRPVLRFSAEYPKLYGQRSARLLEVLPITIDENTPSELIEYDTKTNRNGHYKLKPGQNVQLIFIGNKAIPFCTIRSRFFWDGKKELDKLEYFQKLVGKVFEIRIEIEKGGV